MHNADLRVLAADSNPPGTPTDYPVANYAPPSITAVDDSSVYHFGAGTLTIEGTNFGPSGTLAYLGVSQRDPCPAEFTPGTATVPAEECQTSSASAAGVTSCTTVVAHTKIVCNDIR